MKIVKRQPRRRDGLQSAPEIRAERDKLDAYVKHGAKNQRLSLMAYGAMEALNWVLDNRQGRPVSINLELVAVALKWQKRPPMKMVPRMVRRPTCPE